jgi:hypothetical protein
LVPINSPTLSRDRSAQGRAPATSKSEKIGSGSHVKPGRKTNVTAEPAPQQKQAPLVRTKTLRLEPTFERGLVILKGVLKMPINKMVNEAVGQYIHRQAAIVEATLTTTLEELQAYRRSDPEFEVSRQAFIESEALLGKGDPMEGEIVQVKRPAGAPAATRFVSRARAAASDPPIVQRAVGTRKRD